MKPLAAWTNPWLCFSLIHLVLDPVLTPTLLHLLQPVVPATFSTFKPVRYFHNPLLGTPDHCLITSFISIIYWKSTPLPASYLSPKIFQTRRAAALVCLYLCMFMSVFQCISCCAAINMCRGLVNDSAGSAAQQCANESFWQILFSDCVSHRRSLVSTQWHTKLFFSATVEQHGTGVTSCSNTKPLRSLKSDSCLCNHYFSIALSVVLFCCITMVSIWHNSIHFLWWDQLTHATGCGCPYNCSSLSLIRKLHIRDLTLCTKELTWHNQCHKLA